MLKKIFLTPQSIYILNFKTDIVMFVRINIYISTSIRARTTQFGDFISYNLLYCI